MHKWKIEQNILKCNSSTFVIFNCIKLKFVGLYTNDYVHVQFALFF